MFMSQALRDAYFLLQNNLQSTAARLRDDSQPMGEEDSTSLRQRASDLRHQLSADLGAAERPRQRWIVPKSVPSSGSEVGRGSSAIQS